MLREAYLMAPDAQFLSEGYMAGLIHTGNWAELPSVLIVRDHKREIETRLAIRRVRL